MSCKRPRCLYGGKHMMWNVSQSISAPVVVSWARRLYKPVPIDCKKEHITPKYQAAGGTSLFRNCCLCWKRTYCAHWLFSNTTQYSLWWCQWGMGYSKIRHANSQCWWHGWHLAWTANALGGILPGWKEIMDIIIHGILVSIWAVNSCGWWSLGRG